MSLQSVGYNMDSLLEIRRRAQEVYGQEAGAAPQLADSPKDYRAIFRAAYTFHEQHSPPRLEAGYWAETAKDLTGIMIDFNQDPLLSGLLHAIYADLEREYKHTLEAQQSA